jgi:hypothetical protein
MDAPALDPLHTGILGILGHPDHAPLDGGLMGPMGPIIGANRPGPYNPNPGVQPQSAPAPSWWDQLKAHVQSIDPKKIEAGMKLMQLGQQMSSPQSIPAPSVGVTPMGGMWKP